VLLLVYGCCYCVVANQQDWTNSFVVNVVFVVVAVVEVVMVTN